MIVIVMSNFIIRMIMMMVLMVMVMMVITFLLIGRWFYVLTSVC